MSLSPLFLERRKHPQTAAGRVQTLPRPVCQSTTLSPVDRPVDCEYHQLSVNARVVPIYHPVDRDPSVNSLLISESRVGRSPGQLPTGFSSLVQHRATKRSTDFNSYVSQLTTRSTEPLSNKFKSSIIPVFYPLFTFSASVRFFESEPNTNESNTAPRSTHNLCHEINTWSPPIRPNADVGSPYDSDESLMQNYNWFQMSPRIQTTDPKSIKIEFVIPSGNSLQTPISIVAIRNFQLSLTK